MQVLAAHATGATAVQAADEVADRLRRQLRRVVDADVAQRDEPAGIEVALAALPVARSALARGEAEAARGTRDGSARPYVDHPLATLEAITELLDLWSWCFVDDVAMRIPEVQGPTRIPPSPLGSG